MDVTNMLSYQRWRNRLEREGISRILSVGGESFGPSILRHASALLEREREVNPLERNPMSKLPHDKDEREMRRLLEKLSETYYKEKVFRKSKVEALKRLIRLNRYHVSGKEVVKKWFPETEEES